MISLLKRQTPRLSIALAAALLLAAFAADPAQSATITLDAGAVGVNGGDGCSMAEAILNADGDDQSGSTECIAGSGVDTIVLVEDLVRDDDYMGSGFAFPVINETLIIDGQGYAIQRDSASAVEFALLGANTNLTVRNTSFENGLTSTGAAGGLIVAGLTATLSNVDFINNSGDISGGFISLGAASLIDTHFEGNEGSDAGGAATGDGVSIARSSFVDNVATSMGGGLTTGGSAELFDVTFSDNEASDGGGGAFIQGSVTAYDLTVTNNTVTNAGTGGGLAIGGTFDLDVQTMDANLIQGNTTNEGDGGGVYVLGDATIANTTFDGNTITDAGAAGEFDGGGLYADSTATLSDVTFTNNTADFYGGGFFAADGLTLHDSLVQGNSAQFGGGFTAGTGDVLLDNVTILENEAAQDGAGFSVGDVVDSLSLEIRSSRIEGNTAASLAGAFYAYITEEATLYDTVIDGNEATNGIGGLFIDSPVVEVRMSAITNNTAGGDAGGGEIRADTLLMDYSEVSGNTAAAAQGGLFVTNNGTPDRVTIKRSLFADNTSEGGDGGGLYVSNIDTDIANTTITGNSADRGGGIFVNAPTVGDYLLTNVTLTGNSAATAGSGVFIVDGDFFYANSILRGNTGADDCEASGTGVFNSESYNLLGASCTLDATDQDLDPQLGALADNGGPTRTMAPAEGSPAIDGGNPGGCLNLFTAQVLLTDQRGVARPNFNGLCDAGAYEASVLPALILIPDADPFAVPEGDTGEVTVQLSEQPFAGETVTVTLTSPDPAQVALSPTELTFDETNWDTPQVVTVSPVADMVDEGTLTYEITATSASDLDASPFGDLEATQTVDVADLPPALVVTETDGDTAVTEGGAADTYSVALNQPPAAGETVTVYLLPGDQLAASPTELTFDETNWDTAQEVSVTALSDGAAEGDHTGTVQHFVSSSDDESNFNGVSASLTVDIADLLLANGGFEEPLDPATNWTATGTGDIRFETPLAPEGDFAYLFNGGGPTIETIEQEVSLAVTGGDVVELSFAYGGQSIPADAALGARLTLSDSSETNPDQQVLCLLDESFSGGTIVPAVTATCSITAEADFDTLLVELGWGFAESGRFGFDDVSLAVNPPASLFE